MKPIFVGVHNGEKRIYWGRFVLASIVAVVVAAALGEAVVYLATGEHGRAVPMFASALTFLLVIRGYLRLMAYQPQEVENAIDSA